MVENRSPFVLILISLHFSTKKLSVATNVEVIDRSDLELLSDYDLKFLKDFVHRRGKGFVSRVPLNGFSIEEPQTLDTSSNEIININGQIRIAPKVLDQTLILKLTTPSSVDNNVSNSMKEIDFQRLALILQKLNRKRRTKKPKEPFHMSSSSWTTAQGSFTITPDTLLYNKPVKTYLTRNGFQKQLVTVSEQISLRNSDSDKVNDTAKRPTEDGNTDDNSDPVLTGEQPTVSSTMNNSKTESATDHEGDIRELTRQLNILLTAIKQQELVKDEAQNPDMSQNLTPDEGEKPRVYVLREGNAIQYGENNYEFIATITLIVDGNKSIIVDTGLATDPEVKQIIEEGLNKYGIKASEVSIVISTHGHSAHSGNNNMFVNADQYNSVFQHRYNRFKLSALFEDEIETLTPNVFLQRTPGHTSEDISVIIKNTEHLGTIVVAGDIFMREEDSSYPMMWKPLSSNITEQMESRKKLFCIANYIIPGHGPMFSITTEMKLQQDCKYIGK